MNYSSFHWYIGNHSALRSVEEENMQKDRPMLSMIPDAEGLLRNFVAIQSVFKIVIINELMPHRKCLQSELSPSLLPFSLFLAPLYPE